MLWLIYMDLYGYMVDRFHDGIDGLVMPRPQESSEHDGLVGLQLGKLPIVPIGFGNVAQFRSAWSSWMSNEFL